MERKIEALKLKELIRAPARKLSPVPTSNPFLLPHPNEMDGYIIIYFKRCTKS